MDMHELNPNDEVYPLRGVNIDPRCKVNLERLLSEAEQRRLAVESISLVPEPTNPFDPNAIKVEINGLIVGYIPKDWTFSLHQRFSPHWNVPVGIYRWGRFTGNDGNPTMYCEVVLKGNSNANH